MLSDYTLKPNVEHACIAVLCWCIGLATYRLYLSPLARFPGPRLAAITGWYEFYYDYWLCGKFVFEVERLHNRYGAIVRINPHELSIRDPEFYNEIYVTEHKRRTDSDGVFGRGLNLDDTFLLTKDHDLHSKRRKPFEPFFSRTNIRSLQDAMAEITLRLESRFREPKSKDKVIRLDHAFTCLAADIMRTICLGHKQSDDQFLGDPDFSPEWFNVMHKFIRLIPLLNGLPWITNIASVVPEQVVLWLSPQLRVFKILDQIARRNLRIAIAETSKDSTNADSLFHHLARSDMPPAEKTEDRLTKEAQIVLMSGTLTIARAISVASYYILSNPGLRSNLETELRDTMSGWPQRVPTCSELGRLPLLQGIIKETLRISYGSMHRLPRVSPTEPIRYKEYLIPPGVPVGMSAYMMHNDADVYPSPGKFMPGRWIGEVDPLMHRNWVPFSRGSRGCLGKSLGEAEMNLVLAVLFRPGGPKFELFETDESDAKLVHDYAIPLPRLDSKGIRVVIR